MVDKSHINIYRSKKKIIPKIFSKQRLSNKNGSRQQIQKSKKLVEQNNKTKQSQSLHKHL